MSDAVTLSVCDHGARLAVVTHRGETKHVAFLSHEDAIKLRDALAFHIQDMTRFDPFYEEKRFAHNATVNAALGAVMAPEAESAEG